WIVRSEPVGRPESDRTPGCFHVMHGETGDGGCGMEGDGSTRGGARHERRAGVSRIATRMLYCMLFVLLAGTHGIAAHAGDQSLAPPVGEVLLTVSGSIRNGNAPGVAAFDESALQML